jgi:hypothetical protein
VPLERVVEELSAVKFYDTEPGKVVLKKAELRLK